MYTIDDKVVHRRQHLQDGGCVEESGSSGEMEDVSSSVSSSSKLGGNGGAESVFSTMGASIGHGHGEAMQRLVAAWNKEKGKNDPNSPDLKDFFSAKDDLGGFLGSGSFMGLMAAVMVAMIKFATQASVMSRQEKVVEMESALIDSTKAAESLEEGARNALVAGVIGGIVGLVGAGIGVVTGGLGTKYKGQSSVMKTEAEELTSGNPLSSTEAEVGLVEGGATGPLGEGGSAQSGDQLLALQRSRMLKDASNLEGRASKMEVIGRISSQVSSVASGVSGTSSSTMMTNAQASSAKLNATATERNQQYSIEESWQQEMAGARSTVMSLLQEMSRTYTQAASSAFRS